LEIKEKFCPVCKNKNDREAVVCIHCGSSLENHRMESLATTKNADKPQIISAKIPESVIDDSQIPEDGIAIYTSGTSKPVYLHFDRELVFGRKGDEKSNDILLDLTDLGGYQAGISRRHALIRRVEAGYEIIDLASTNGSWMNEERLVPNKPYPLTSGAQLRFGRMRLLILYHTPKKIKTK
jgi:pSer/pThr/pTyr-binding forkhead associated (FHA) protein